MKMSSRPEELHLRALPEPCMTLSSHTAPDVRPLLERLCLVHGLLPFPVGQCPRPNNAAPSVRLHYRASSLLRAAPPLCSASVLWSLRCAPLGRLPWHRSDRFSRSVQEPG